MAPAKSSSGLWKNVFTNGSLVFTIGRAAPFLPFFLARAEEKVASGPIQGRATFPKLERGPRIFAFYVFKSCSLGDLLSIASNLSLQTVFYRKLWPKQNLQPRGNCFPIGSLELAPASFQNPNEFFFFKVRMSFWPAPYTCHAGWRPWIWVHLKRFCFFDMWQKIPAHSRKVIGQPLGHPILADDGEQRRHHLAKPGVSVLAIHNFFCVCFFFEFFVLVEYVLAFFNAFSIAFLIPMEDVLTSKRLPQQCILF